MPQAISNLTVGALVKDMGTKHFGVPIVWKIASKSHPGYPINSVTLISKDVIRFIAPDGLEVTHPESLIRTRGNGRYFWSNIRIWLNSNATGWYTAQHAYDAPPNSTNVTYNPYDNIAGFLFDFSSPMQTALLSTTLTVTRPGIDGGGSETVTDKIFLLSRTEVGLGAQNGVNEGSLLALFNTADSSRQCKPTAQAVAYSEYSSSGINISTNSAWTLRTPEPTTAGLFQYVKQEGAIQWGIANSGTLGLRPALNIPNTTFVSDAADADGAYTIVWAENVDFQLVPEPTARVAEQAIPYATCLADPSKVTIKVSNNALDVAPVWETAQQGALHTFSNKSATGTGAISARVTITPSASVPDVFCSGFNIFYF